MPDPSPAAPPGWLLAAHVMGVLVYAGGVIVESRLLGLIAAAAAETRAASAAAARGVYLRLILPFGVLMLGSGLYLLLSDPAGKEYLKKPYFHVKLTLVLMLMAVEHLMVIRPLKGLAKGTADPDRGGALYRAAHPVVLVLVLGILLALFVLRHA